MWLAGSILLLSVLLLACAFTGRAVFAVCGSWRRPIAALWFSPVTGLAVWIHAAALLGWTIGFPRPAALAVMALLLALGAWLLRHQWRTLTRKLWLLAPATLAGGFSLFCCLFRFQAFNPFNDAFTYLVHARWLQHHPFREAVTRDILQPALSQVYLYQSGHHRMGASFLLGWIQSLTGSDWPHGVFPAVIALALACGGLALSGAVALAVPARRRLCLVLGLLPGLTLSGITFGAVHAFLPQSFGLAFGLAALASAGAGMWCPAALCFSAQVYCYPEAIPFTTIGFVALVLLRTTRRSALLTLAAGALLAAPEWPRLAHSLAYQVSAVAGVNSPFSAHEALEHATGFNAGPWQDRMSLFFQPHLNLLVCLLVLAAAAWGLRTARRTAPLLPFAAIAAVLFLAWAWFRFGAGNPWDGTRGDPWRQARVATYAAYPAFVLIASGLALLWRQKPRIRPALGILVAFWLGVGALQHYRLAEPRLQTMQEELLCQSDCWQQLQAIQAAAPSGSVSLQGFTLEHYKLRRFLTYILLDHPVEGTWQDDDYLGPNLPPTQRGAPAPTDWLLTPERPLHFQPRPGRSYSVPKP
ncbi:hypothetical protein [Paludibaculum fermentans]|uniref:Uncharacterized protein n=1 Tax=Paludibaculum fermentans TaxID=1473598 RepID=A0A7S7NK41_PALFE|nr:hypothetical protein [Paludibaculum fermentans]QOY85067.1 hypothetical protein IRI77_19670 [Paludibaculum fermentans]